MPAFTPAIASNDRTPTKASAHEVAGASNTAASALVCEQSLRLSPAHGLNATEAKSFRLPIESGGYQTGGAR
jgi:hypothetical protein